MKQKLSLGEDVLSTIEENCKTEDEEEDIPVYERRSSNQSTTSTSSVDSKTSEKSSGSVPSLKDSSVSSKSSENVPETGPEVDGVKELTENLKSLKVDEKKLSDFDKIKSEVQETKESEVEERAPIRRQYNYHGDEPYRVNETAQRSSKLLNGGTFELPLFNSLPVLTDDVLQVLPPCDTTFNLIRQETMYTLRQPSPISTPNSTPNPYCNVPSPSSGYVSGSLESRSPIHINELPSILPHSSDEEEKRKDAIHEVRAWMDSNSSMKDIKMYEWIQASSKDTVKDLFLDLKRLLTRDRRLTDRKFVRIYAIIAQILNREGDLKHFFLEEFDILSCIVAKNNPLLLRYIIETIFNLGLNPENIGEPVKHIWDVIINSKNVLNQKIDMSEMLTTLLTIKNRNNRPMFSLNEMDIDGYTPLHKILMNMSTDQQLATKYFKICLEHQPDLMLTTMIDSRTYMHHALLWRVPPQIMDEILNYCSTHYSNYNILQELDIDNQSPENIANTLSNNKEEILAIFEKYRTVAVPCNLDFSSFFNNLVDHSWPDE